MKKVTESQSATAAIRNAAGRRSSVKKKTKKKMKKVLQRRTSDLERKVSAKVREVERAVERTEEAKVLGSKAAKRREDTPLRTIQQRLWIRMNWSYRNGSNKNVFSSVIPRLQWLHES